MQKAAVSLLLVLIGWAGWAGSTGRDDASASAAPHVVPVVSVGYADGSWVPAEGLLPTPWVGDRSVQVFGTDRTPSCCLDSAHPGWDTAAVLVRAPATAGLIVESVTIDVGPVHLAPWPGATLAAGQAAIFTGEVGGLWADLSEAFGHVCHPANPTMPVVTVVAGGETYRYVDEQLVLTAGGYDPSSCDHLQPPREGRPWQVLSPATGAVGPSAPPATIQRGCGPGLVVVEAECSPGTNAPVRARAGASGSGTRALTAAGARIDLTITAPSAGWYTPTVRYWATSAVGREVIVNGIALGDMEVQSTDGGYARAVVHIPLLAGANVISLVNDSYGEVEIDQIELLSWPADPRVGLGATTTTVPSGGSTPAITVPTPAPARPGGFLALDPQRALDTRASGGPVGPGGIVTVDMAGRFGIPAVATAVVANITAAEGTAPSFVTAFPAGTPRPWASTLNVAVGDTRPNLAVVALGPGGGIALYNQSGSVQLIVDVLGAFVPTEHPGAGGFHPMALRRALDTRDDPLGPLRSATGLRVDLTARAGLPAGQVRAVVANVTAVDASGPGFVTVYPADQHRPLASNLNVVGPGPRPNLVMVRVDADGAWALATNVDAVHVVIDVVGWFDGDASGGGGSHFVARSPERILDTRTEPRDPPAAGSHMVVAVAGRAAVPAGATAALMNVTATDASVPVYVTLYPAGQVPPLASNLNLTPGETVPNAAVVALAGGSVSAAVNAGRVQLIADVSGWFV